jgi:hypothetical protein
MWGLSPSFLEGMYFVYGSRAVFSSDDAWVTDVSLLQLVRVPSLFIEPFIESYSPSWAESLQKEDVQRQYRQAAG